MKITQRHYSFLAAAVILIFSVVVNIYFSMTRNYSIFDIRFGWPFIIGCAWMIGIAFSLFFSKELWAYLFFFLLIAAFTPFVAIGSFSFEFGIGSLKIPMIPFALMFAHILFNMELIAKYKPTQQQIIKNTEEKKSIYENQFRKKSLEELKNINLKDLTIEARVVIVDLIQEMETIDN